MEAAAEAVDLVCRRERREPDSAAGAVEAEAGAGAGGRVNAERSCCELGLSGCTRTCHLMCIFCSAVNEWWRAARSGGSSARTADTGLRSDTTKPDKALRRTTASAVDAAGG